MKHTSLALLVGILILAAGGLGWFLLAGPDSGVESDDSTGALPKGARPDLVETPIELERANGDGIDGGAEAGAARSGIADTEVEDDGDVTWVTGVVALPEGMPRDPGLEVYALARPVRYGTFIGALDHEGEIPLGMNPDQVADGMAIAQSVLASERVEADGTFRIAFPRSLRKGYLIARGDFLYCEETVMVRLRSEVPSAWLSAVAGTRISGRLTATADLAGTRVRIAPGSSGVNPMAFAAPGVTYMVQTVASAGGTFEFRGVPSGKEYEWVVLPDDLAATRGIVGGLEPGQTKNIEATLDPGGRIVGHVVDDGGRPIPGATVRGHLGGRFFGFDDVGCRDVETDEKGRFELTALPPGPVVVNADHPDHLDCAKKTVEVPEDGAAEGVNLVLTAGKTITGTVTWPDGRPAAGIDVDADFDVTAIAGPSAFNMLRGASADATTDAKGAFVLRGLGAGPFTLRATSERAAEPGASAEETVRFSARLDGVKPGVTGVDLVLRPPLGLYGRVVDLAGEPVTDFTVVADRMVAGEFVSGNTMSLRRDFQTEAGDFFLEGMIEGNWTISTEGEGHIAVEELELELPALSDEPVVIVVERTVTVRGVVVDSNGKPLSGATVRLDEAKQPFSATMNEAPNDLTAVSEDKGVFELQGLPSGSLALVANANGYARSVPHSLDVEPGEVVEEVVLTLTDGGTVTGEVLNEEGKPAAGRMVVLTFMQNFTQRIGSTDAAGEFVFDNVIPGDYQIVAIDTSSDWNPDGEGFDMTAMMNNMDLTQARVIEGEVTHVVIGEPPADPVRVYGKVTHGDEPYTGAIVGFFPEGSRLYERLKMVTVDEDGRYELELHEPGAYVVNVQVLGNSPGQQNTIEFAREIPALEEARVDFEIPLGRISGRVLGPKGRPAPGTRVTLVSQGSARSDSFFGGQYTEIVTEADGSYDVKGLRPDTYKLSAGGASLFNTSGGAQYGRVTKDGLKVGEDQWLQDVDLRLPAPGSIVVTVKDAAGKPLPAATVFVRDEAGHMLEPFSVIQTDGAGRCEYAGVAPGEYTVTARNAELAAPESEPVRVPEAGEVKVSLVVEEGTILWIKLKDTNGDDLRANVSVTDEEGREMSGLFGMQDLQVLYLEGAFSPTEHRLGPLPPGKYRVRAWTDDGREEDKPVRLKGQGEKKLTLRLK